MDIKNLFMIILQNNIAVLKQIINSIQLSHHTNMFVYVH